MTFRKMQREKKLLSYGESIMILKQEKRGVLSLIGDGGYPYGVPMNHFFCEDDGRLYFHSGKNGHKIDAMRTDNKASFCVFDSGYKEEGEWMLNIKSVIVFGKIELIEDREIIYDIARRLSRKFTDDTEYIEREIERSGPGTLMFALVPEHITGKLVKEA